MGTMTKSEKKEIIQAVLGSVKEAFMKTSEHIFQEVYGYSEQLSESRRLCDHLRQEVDSLERENGVLRNKIVELTTGVPGR